MKIHGLQKLTLLDYPGKVACTVFLGGCNLRCPFCHNSELLDMNTAEPIMDDAELLRFLESRRGVLDGVCFTGGEPTLRPELGEVMRAVKALGYPVKLDTNGCGYDHLAYLISEGLVDYVAMDIKNSPDRCAETCGLMCMDMSPIYDSIELLRSGAVDYEFRTTVVDELHDHNSFYEIGSLIAGAKRYFLQPFTDRDTVIYGGLHAPGADKLAEYADIVRPRVESVSIRGAES